MSSVRSEVELGREEAADEDEEGCRASERTERALAARCGESGEMLSWVEDAGEEGEEEKAVRRRRREALRAEKRVGRIL